MTTPHRISERIGAWTVTYRFVTVNVQHEGQAWPMEGRAIASDTGASGYLVAVSPECWNPNVPCPFGDAAVFLVCRRSGSVVSKGTHALDALQAAAGGKL